MSLKTCGTETALILYAIRTVSRTFVTIETGTLRTVATIELWTATIVAFTVVRWTEALAVTAIFRLFF